MTSTSPLISHPLHIDTEPILKYSRIFGDLSSILSSDAISTGTCTDKFLVLGTYMGQVFVIDYSGIIIKSWIHHRSTVTSVCINSTDEYIASAGEDGLVFVCALFSNEIRPFEFRRPIKCLILDPDYIKSSRFVAGGHAGEVAMFERRWTGPRKYVLDTVQGSVLAVSWRGSLIAYVTEEGFGLYDSRLNSIVCKSTVPFNVDRPDLYRPHLVWKSDDLLILGWQHILQVISIKAPSLYQLGYQANIIIQASVEPIIGGVQPYNDIYLILGIWEHDHNDTTASVEGESVDDNQTIPEMLLYDPNQEMEPVKARDIISIRDYTRFHSHDYSLMYLPVDNMYIIVTPKDLISIRPRDINDQIEWCMIRKQYEKAIDLSINIESSTSISKNLLRVEYQSIGLGQRILTELIQEQEYERAANLCPSVLGSSPELWERWIAVFLEHNAINAIIPIVPVINPVLDHTTYEVILAHALSFDFITFSTLIEEWPLDIYTVPIVLNALEDTLTDFPTDTHLLRASIKLYAHEKLGYKELQSHIALNDYDKALILLDQYPVITGPLIRQRARQWFTFCFKHEDNDINKFLASHALYLIVNRTHLVEPHEVYFHLSGERQYQFAYLFALYTKDLHEGTNLHGELLELIADYRPKSLLEFLQRSMYYPLDQALQLTETRHLLPEQVFVLGRMGNHKRAMVIMMEHMDNIDMAIEYAKRQQDNDLWDDLLEFAVNKPKYWAPLFKSTGMAVDPIRLIRRVPRGAQIPGLKELLLTIVHDFSTQVEVRSQANNVLRHDVIQFMTATMRKGRGGVPIDKTIRCRQCGKLVGHRLMYDTEVIAGPMGVIHVPTCPI